VTDEDTSETQRLQKLQNFKPKVKHALAMTRTKAGITVEQARRAFQSKAEMFYNDEFYLGIKNVPKNLSQLNKPPPTLPHSSTDYEKYARLLMLFLPHMLSLEKSI